MHNLRFEASRLIATGEFTNGDYGLSDLLLFSRFVDDGVILNVDGSFTTLCRLKPNDMDAETSESREYARLVIHRAVQHLDTGWCLHLDCVRTESTGYIVEDDCHFKDATSSSIDFERRMQYKRAGKHYENEYILTFTYLPPGDNRSKLGAFFQTGAKQEFDYTIYLDKFKETVYGVLNILASSQFQIFKLSDEEIFQHLFYCINGIKTSMGLPRRHWTDLRYMLAQQDMVTGNYPKIGNKYIGIVSMGESFPLESYPMLLRGLNSLSFEYRWSTRYIFLSVADATKMINKIADFHYQKRESATKVLSKKYGTGESGKINRSAVRYANEAEEALSSMEMSDWRYGKYTASIIIYDEDAELLAEKLKIVKGVIDNCNLLGKVEKVNAIEAYLGAIPSMVRPNVRKWIMNSYNLADLIPTSSIWSGYKNNPCKYYAKNNPVLFYASTAGDTPFRGCLHVGDEGHTLVIGSNGSVALNFLAVQQLRYKNAKVFVFDNNHATLALTHGINNSIHYDLGYGEDVRSFMPLANLDTQEDFTFAVRWLCELCTVNGFQIKPQHVSAISSTLEMIRDSALPAQRTMSYFAYHMRPKGENMEDFASQFKPYIATSAGLQSQIFDADNDLLTLKDFSVFEMSQLNRAGDATLIPAVLYLFHMIERSLDGSPVAIYLHDGFSIFKHPVFSSYLDEWLRKIAAKNVQLIIGVDQAGDILKADITDILMQSCKSKLFTANLNANGTQLASYEKLGLNTTQIDLIAQAMPYEYYFTNQLGSRLINFNLGELSQVFLEPPSIEEQEQIKTLKALHQDKFGYAWIKHKGLNPKVAEYWLEQHNSLEADHE